VWLASPEAYFLKDKFFWVNWDAEELLARADEIQSTKLLNWIAEGVPCECLGSVHAKPRVMDCWPSGFKSASNSGFCFLMPNFLYGGFLLIFIRAAPI
jgi:hypothetical protein